MLPNFKRSETEPPKVSPSFAPASTSPTPSASSRPIGLARSSERNAPSVIGPDLTINGNLISKGEVQIDGEVQGDIQGTYVVIGEKARITGGIVAEEIVVRGHVMGSVRGKRVMLQSSSHVEGDIFHQALAIEQGAFFEGKSRRSDDPTGDSQKPEFPSLSGSSLG
jgi:cytoskeletal protein CcmA (bactofilin family)